MVRKSIMEVRGQINLNEEDTDAVITLLLKRMCTHEEAIEYLLSAIISQTKDDMLGELMAQERRKIIRDRSKP